MINELIRKKMLVAYLESVYMNFFPETKSIKLKAYELLGSYHTEEFVLLTWKNGGISTANNNCNSLSATARNVARMVDGGVYENIELYKEIMEDKNRWVELAKEG